MTEVDWENSSSPIDAFSTVSHKSTDRQRRLFAVACCRNIWHLIDDERCRNAVELSELAADVHVDEKLLDSVSSQAWEAFEEETSNQTEELDDLARVHSERRSSAYYATSYASNSPLVRVEDVFEVIQSCSDAVIFSVAEGGSQTALLRDIFGNPFRPVAFNSAWRSSTAIALAQTMYDARDFAAMPILADALQDAGCEDDAILNHCRGDGPHVRGCWVVDLVLNKS